MLEIKTKLLSIYNPNTGKYEEIDTLQGISPTVDVSNIEGGHRLTITDKNNTEIIDVMDGSNGKSAYESAQEGGFIGTEEEFAERLAGLSTEDYTTEEKIKLANIEEGATRVIVDSEFIEGSTNAIQSKAVLTAWNNMGNYINLHLGDASNPHSVTKAQVGLGNVENKSSDTIRGELTKSNVTDALGYTPPTTEDVNDLLSNFQGGTNITYGTEDLIAGETELAEGEVYLVYE